MKKYNILHIFYTKYIIELNLSDLKLAQNV